jgi:Ca2+-binding RTX toxin-like protein
VFAIWDAGGNDTLNLSGYATASEIDLREEAFSSAGPNPSTGGASVGNIAIARGAVIENAIGGAGADTIFGNAVGNKLLAGGGADSISGFGGDDFLYGLDASAQQLTDNALSVRRLYLATLDRGPDAIGWADWTGKLDAGMSLVSITSGFVNSAEFQSVYGSLNNTAFVTLLYNNVLHRAPDPTGLNNWLGALAGGASREAIVNAFSESQEFRISSDTSAHGAQVYRLFGATLGREPDPTGFLNYANVLDNNDTLDSVASAFVNSTEFRNTYGALNNTQFVTLLYNNVLHRAPDATGLNGWVSQLDGGASRTSVVLGFSESNEYKAATRAGLTTFIATAFPGETDFLDGGTGNDALDGGRGVDTYVFTKGQGGSDHIYGFETWDHVQLNGFGYASAAQARSHLTQVGPDLVFADQGETITFHGFDITYFDTDIWGFG